MNQSKSVNYIEETCKTFDRRMESVGVAFARFELVKRIADAEAENARLRTALHDAINRPKGVVPDSALEFYEAGSVTICPDCNAEATWYHDADGMSRAVCKNKCKGWKVLQEVARHKSA